MDGIRILGCHLLLKPDFHFGTRLAEAANVMPNAGADGRSGRGAGKEAIPIAGKTGVCVTISGWIYTPSNFWTFLKRTLYTCF